MAQRIERLAAERWGGLRPTVLVGTDLGLMKALDRVSRFAASDSPVLITGETGTGKELFARALYLLREHRSGPLLSINCAQYHDGQLIASELFGHRRGSFTGAIADHRGMFEEADNGVIFLDEVGELSLAAQAMLLRVLGESEIVPVGSTKATRVHVRVVAATSRNLLQMVQEGSFRSDLYYRLNCLHVVVPPVRERGDDWALIVRHYLDQLIKKSGHAKRMSADSCALLKRHDWPGNVREVKSVVDTGFHLSDDGVIEPLDFMDQLQAVSRFEVASTTSIAREDDLAVRAMNRMLRDAVNFWDAVHTPYLAHELTRADARQIIEDGLHKSRGSYKRLVALFNLPASEYLKFMDFLRHQRLKPDDGERGSTLPSVAMQ
ncbi:MAG: sigma 54-interacting transcriptional regulator [bacterium]